MKSSLPTVHIGLIGLGVVGQGVWKHIQQRRKALATHCGAELVLHKAAVRDLERARDIRIPASKLTDDAMSVATDPAIDVVCELMGGIKLAKKVTLAALKSGKTVVTANKALLSEHGAEIFAAAEAGGGRVFFEAAVAGGIPIIKALREGLAVNRFPVIYGILNGTCNYILTRMEREGKGFEEIVGDARRLGYVEADESLDLDGWDTAHKAAIVAWLAHGRWISMKEMPVEGIRDVSLEDIEWASKLGYKIKLLATIIRDLKQGTVFASVHPTLVPQGLALSRVDEVFNGVSVTGDVVGETVFVGRGAGRDATASAVVSDVVDAALYKVFGGPATLSISADEDLRFATLDEVRQAFYLRMTVKDRPGVLATITKITAEHEISIESLVQTPGPKAGTSNLVLTTHIASEKQVASLVADLSKARGTVVKKPFVLRIANFED
jgi:homoserine dehydrogenase